MIEPHKEYLYFLGEHHRKASDHHTKVGVAEMKIYGAHRAHAEHYHNMQKASGDHMYDVKCMKAEEEHHTTMARLYKNLAQASFDLSDLHQDSAEELDKELGYE